MTFQRDFNELLNEILTSYRNQFPGEVTQGSVLFIKATCTASMLWGLYRQLDKAADQIFVSTADRAHAERHAAEYGIPTQGLSDAQIVEAVLEAKRSKAAGGNRYDYVAWANSVTLNGERVSDAVVVPLAQGEGTFDIVVAGKDGQVSPELCGKILEYIQFRRPIGAGFSWGIRVLPATIYSVPIRIRGVGASWDREGTRAALTSYVDGLAPGQTLARSVLFALAHEYGAESVNVVTPTADVVPGWSPPSGLYNVLRSSSVEVED
jgi:uncharacterized phage protein gp47/JayE